MKKATKALLWLGTSVGAAVAGAWAWANRDRAVTTALTNCRPTPAQLDAFGKENKMRIVIGGTENSVGLLDASVVARFDQTKGILQQQSGAMRINDTRLTASLCAFVTRANIATQVRTSL